MFLCADDILSGISLSRLVYKNIGFAFASWTMAYNARPIMASGIQRAICGKMLNRTMPTTMQTMNRKFARGLSCRIPGIQDTYFRRSKTTCIGNHNDVRTRRRARWRRVLMR